jgi:hypothetical protein
MEAGVFLGVDHGGSTTTALVYDPEQGKRGTGSVRMPKGLSSNEYRGRHGSFGARRSHVA